MTGIDYLYRYRPIEAALDGFRELEEQHIYFSTPDELNDPIEGFKDLFWCGDAIAWRNLLRHYVLCFLQTTYYCFFAGPEFNPDLVNLYVFSVPETLPEAPIREVYGRVVAEFLEEPSVIRFLELMSTRTTPVRRGELTGYLRALHGFALQIVLKDLQQRGLLAQKEAGPGVASLETARMNAIRMMEGVTQIASEEYPPEKISEALFSASEAAVEQLLLISAANSADWQRMRPIAFFAQRFPTKYVGALDRLVHRDWYVACFARTPTDHSMWSTYAGGHRGICLVFKPDKTTEGYPQLVLERITGMGGSKKADPEYYRSEVPHVVQPVRYTPQYPAIDFFQSLGAISQSHVDRFWYAGGESFSKCREAIHSDLGAWRKDYWKRFEESAMYKTPEWKHEEEYRIVVHSLFDLGPKDRRKLRYRFQDLAGIVFGARTDIEDKLKILKIIDAKCAKAKRSDFKFFEIRYLPTESRFQMFPLDLLKIKY
jgi:hypothetical protein